MIALITFHVLLRLLDRNFVLQQGQTKLSVTRNNAQSEHHLQPDLYRKEFAIVVVFSLEHIPEHI